MIIKVLGTGSNGGVPQWDCCCPNCMRARRDTGLRRTRSSVAVSLDGYHYVLVDTGPDLKFQLEWNGLTPQVDKADNYRQSHIKVVLLTHGHGDHTSGLAEFSTGKSFSIPVYAPPDLIEFLFGTQDRISYFGELDRLAKDYVVPHPLEENTGLSLLDGLSVRGFEIEHTDVLEDGTKYPSSTYGYELTSDGGRFVYTPDLGRISEELLNIVAGADVFMLDATFWYDDELDRISGIPITSHDLGHVPVEESLEILEETDVDRMIYTHLNHTNPLNDLPKWQGEELKSGGFELSYDGMVVKI